MPNEKRGTGNTLGNLISNYRLRQRHEKGPWSQLDLALACETDQAHISRIENDRYHPQFETLVRICDALALSQTERAYVLARAGYHVVRPLPDRDAVHLISSKLAPLLDTYPYPALLIDEGERIWYLNAPFARLWGPCYQVGDQRDCLPLLLGKRTLELIFGLDLHEPLLSAWQSYFEDFDTLLTRIVALFWRAYQARPQDAGMNRTLSRLMQHPVFRQLWERISAGETDLVLLEHAAYTVRVPTVGSFRINAWRTHCGLDERFLVVHHTPVDGDGVHALARLQALTPTVRSATSL
jgi:transcriptional regulator with XRE-family HTH domain